MKYHNLKSGHDAERTEKDYLIFQVVKMSDYCRQNSLNFPLSNPNICHKDLFDEFMKRPSGKLKTRSWTNILIFLPANIYTAARHKPNIKTPLETVYDLFRKN